MCLTALLVGPGSGEAQGDDDAEPALPLFGIVIPDEDDAAPDPTDPVAVDVSQIATRFEARMSFLDMVETRDYTTAIAVGERMVAFTSEEFGADSSERAVELAEVAEIRRRAGEFDRAEEDFLASIATLTRNEGTTSALLIQPMVGLGVSYQDMGEHGPAVSAFSEARTLTRRNFGLLSESQIPILDRLTDSYIEMGRYLEADRQQLEALRLLERTRGSDTPEILPGIYRYARWLRAQGRYEEERYYYMRAMNIVKESSGRDSIEMVKPLREVANSFRAQKFPEGLGASSLKRALDILAALEQPDPLEMATTLRDLGDWYAAFSKVGRGGEEYRESWNILGELPNGAELREAWYDKPSFVLYETPSQRGLRPEGSEPGLEQGFVLVNFDVTPEGRTENVTVAESDPPGKKDEAIVRAMRRSRFRPRVIEGEVVRADQLARRFTFSFKPAS
jgi:TonB family protein